jgi:hypothetical protein
MNSGSGSRGNSGTAMPSAALINRPHQPWLGLARGVRRSVIVPLGVSSSHKRASFRVSRLRGDDSVEQCRCHPSTLCSSLLIPHPSPIGQRLSDYYPPLNGEGYPAGLVVGWVSAVR